MSLRDKLLPKGSLRERLSELVTGSYTVTKITDPADTIKVVDKPNIIERIAGDRTETKHLDTTSLRSYNDTNYKTDLPSVEPLPEPDLEKPRKKNLLNKIRAKIEDVFDGEDDSEVVATAIEAVESEPQQAVPIEDIETEPQTAPIDISAPVISQDNERFRQGIIYNENRGTIAAGKDPYKAVGPTGDVGKYQASPATIAAWTKPWLGKKYTVEDFKNDPEAQEKFFDEFLKVKEKYDVNDEDAAIMWHRGWGVLGYDDTFEEKKRKLQKYLDEIRDDAKSIAYRQSFLEGTTTKETE